MLSQLIYVSGRTVSCTDDQIKKILESCEKNNPSLGITGVLLYSENRFVQLVEGEAKVLMSLYDKIKLDARHSNVRMISYGPIKQKKFPSWHMAAKKVNNFYDYLTDISSDDKKMFQEILNGVSQDGNKVNQLLQKFFA